MSSAGLARPLTERFTDNLCGLSGSSAARPLCNPSTSNCTTFEAKVLAPSQRNISWKAAAPAWSMRAGGESSANTVSRNDAGIWGQCWSLSWLSAQRAECSATKTAKASGPKLDISAQRLSKTIAMCLALDLTFCNFERAIHANRMITNNRVVTVWQVRVRLLGAETPRLHCFLLGACSASQVVPKWRQSSPHKGCAFHTSFHTCIAFLYDIMHSMTLVRSQYTSSLWAYAYAWSAAFTTEPSAQATEPLMLKYCQSLMLLGAGQPNNNRCATTAKNG